ncbi:thioredoxin-related transmembrane protein 2 homolog [Palaemon carinicauda]|uniref:thioredoxin-related transmembrane protein 2 homolog n=1 Tax=Palaemon carinicauda TaxID=392227 RepID=UPI0035B63319
MTLLDDAKQLVHPFYVLNILMSLSFLGSKYLPGVCEYVFPKSECGELSMWESEILFFMVVIVMFRTRKSGSRNMLSYISTAAMYAKICNVLLWFYADPVYGVLYVVVVIVHFLIIGEPVYKGPEKVVYFQGKALDEELNRDRNCIWLITFFTAWSPTCSRLAPIFSKLSAEYTLDNLKFGKVDVGRYPEAAKHYHINDTAFSVQLPTISLFKDGKEVERRPCLDSKQKFQKFYFTEDNIKAGFDLNNIYMERKKVLEAKQGKKEEHKKTD